MTHIVRALLRFLVLHGMSAEGVRLVIELQDAKAVDAFKAGIRKEVEILTGGGGETQPARFLGVEVLVRERKLRANS